MAIPEMMRLLMDEKGLGWDEAWDIVTHVFAYTSLSRERTKQDKAARKAKK